MMNKTRVLLSVALVAGSLFSCAKKDEKPADQPVVPVDTAIHYYQDTIRKDGLTLIFKDLSTGIDSGLRKKMIDIFFLNYPKLMRDFNPSSLKTVYFTIDPAYSGVAETSGGKVRYSFGYFKNFPKDVDVVTHEIMHIVQAYSNGDPFWVTEGIADYVRYVYGVDNAGAGWSLPNYSSSQSYTDAYRVTARFFYWLDVKVKAGIVKSLDARMRAGSYTESFWVNETGKTIDQLWSDYGENPAL